MTVISMQIAAAPSSGLGPPNQEWSPAPFHSLALRVPTCPVLCLPATLIGFFRESRLLRADAGELS